MTQPKTIVGLSAQGWIGLITTISLATASSIGMMWRLDDKWDRKFDKGIASVRSEIKSVRESIPPDWFREMVESNQKSIDKNQERMNALDKKIFEILTVLKERDSD